MKLHFLPTLSLITCSFLLSACSTNTDYLEAKTLPPVSAPENLDQDRLGQLYPVPEQKETKFPTKFSVPYPPTVGAQDDASVASIQTMGDEFWVVDFQPSATTWAQLVNFWQQKRVGLVGRDLDSATMTTNWFSEALPPGSKIRYRLRLEQGLQPNTTDIFIYNEKSLINEPIMSEQVEERLSDRFHGELLAKQLVAAMNAADTGVGDSYLAATINLPQKVNLTEVDGEPALLSVARASRLDRAFSRSLSKDGFVLYGEDKGQSVYYFGKVKTGKKSWFDFSSDEDRVDSNDQSLSVILSSLPDEPEVNRLFPDVTSRDTSKSLSDSKGYLLVLRQQPKGIVVHVRDSAGQLLPADEAIDLLDTIRLRLI